MSLKMEIKGLKERLNDLLEAKADGILEKRSVEFEDQEIEKLREEIIKKEEELRGNCVAQKSIKGGDNMEKKEFRDKVLAGENIADVEVRAMHMGYGSTEGTNVGQTQQVTVQREILRKLGDDAVIVGMMPFEEMAGKRKIAISDQNKGKVALVSEGEVFGQKDYDLTLKEIELVKMGQMSVISNESLQDSEFDLQGFIINETARDYARKVEELMLVGQVVGKAEGMLMAEQSPVTTTAGAGVIALKDLTNAYYNLAPELRQHADLVFVCDNATNKAIHLLEDGNGKPLIQSSTDPLTGRPVEYIFGARIVEVRATNMPDGVMGAFAVPTVAMKAFVGRNFNVNVDQSKRSEYDQTVLVSSMRFACAVVDPSAVSLIKAK